VTVGAPDTQCALAGLGVTEPGAAGVVLGWSATVQTVTSLPVRDAEQRTWTGMHILPVQWVAESNAGDAGMVWQWLCATLGLSEDEGAQLAMAAPRGSGDVLASLGLRAMNARAMTAGVGALTLPVPLTMSAPDRGTMLRAALESIAYAVRANVEQLEVVTRQPITGIAAGGGMLQAPGFAQMLADVLGRPVATAPGRDATAAGAAAIAAPPLGLQASAEAAVAALAPPCTLTPDLRASAEYDDSYARWQALTALLEDGAI
jgi:sugar (pentulose or hexulose) kinase